MDPPMKILAVLHHMHRAQLPHISPVLKSWLEKVSKQLDPCVGL